MAAAKQAFQQCTGIVYFEPEGASVRRTAARQCRRPGKTDGLCHLHRRCKENIYAEVIGEDELCGFCGNGPAKAFRTSCGEGIVTICQPCRRAMRRLLYAIEAPEKPLRDRGSESDDDLAARAERLFGA